MPAALLALLCCTIALAGIGCASGPKTAAPPARISEQAAQARIRERLQADAAGQLPQFAMPVRETTPEGVFDDLGVQTFQITDDLYRHESFAVTAVETLRIGSGFGGPGITEYRVGDADGNGEPDVLFVSGSGRGVKTFALGILDRPGYEPFDSSNPPLVGSPGIAAPMRVRDFRVNYRFPMEVRDRPDGGLDLYDSGRDVRLGRLVFNSGSAEFRAADDLPLAIKRRFSQPRL